jgi:predicted Na+-dependent transporter
MFVNLFEFGSVEALAIFLYGCCPGGSASNNWTILFDGDINLSAVMTFASNIGSLGKQTFYLLI